MASLDQNYNTGIVPPHLRTGGGLPPTPVSTFTPTLPNGGGTPPTSTYTPTLPNGGGTPPTPVSTFTPTLPNGGGTPPTPVYTPTLPNGGGSPPIPLSQQTPNQGNFGPVQTVQQTLDGFINGQYAANARRRGLEQANRRGLLNSSMAAGAAERAALESVQPFVAESMNFLNNREDRALRQQLQNDAVLQQNWLQTNQFNNQFNAQLKMLPVTNSLQMLQALTQYALSEPEVFTPNVMNGYTNFFNQNMLSVLKQYFPGAK